MVTSYRRILLFFMLLLPVQQRVHLFTFVPLPYRKYNKYKRKVEAKNIFRLYFILYRYNIIDAKKKHEEKKGS